MPRFRCCAALLLVVGFAAAGAGPAGAGTARAAKPTPADQAILSAGVVTGADVPAGWTSSRQRDNGTAAYRGVVGCGPVFAAITAARRTVPVRLSAEFSPPGSANQVTVVDDIVLAFPSAPAAGRFLAAYSGPTVPDCLQRVLTKTAKGAAQVSVAQLDDLQGVGDANAGYEATIVASGGGQSLTAVGDVVVVRVGRAVALLSYLNDGSVTLPAGMSVVTAVTDRLESVPTR